jgi:ferredoxin-NADP reductase
MQIHREHLQLRIDAIEEMAPWVRRFSVAAADAGPLPGFACGDRIDVQLAEGVWCPFSLTGSPHARHRYQFVVRGKERSHASSTHALFHDAVAGATLLARLPAPGLALAAGAGPHVFIAGGVGLTAVAAHIEWLARQRVALQLHYACHAPMLGLADALGLAGAVPARCYVSERGQRLDPQALLAGLPAGAHLYVCGPVTLVESVLRAAIAMHWPMAQVHWDRGVRLPVPWPDLAPALDMAA